MGAVVEKGVTKRTTMLVVADGFTGSDPADFTTGKAAKAVHLRARGHRIDASPRPISSTCAPRPHLGHWGKDDLGAGQCVRARLVVTCELDAALGGDHPEAVGDQVQRPPGHDQGAGVVGGYTRMVGGDGQ